jgi:uncharacterized protein YggT (Ycf19 family)
MFKLAAKIAYMVAILAQLLISLRFILKFINADPNNQYSKWLFENTEPLIAPLRGLVQESIEFSGFHVEVVSLVAIICLMLITSILSQMVKTL